LAYLESVEAAKPGKAIPFCLVMDGPLPDFDSPGSSFLIHFRQKRYFL